MALTKKEECELELSSVADKTASDVIPLLVRDLANSCNTGERFEHVNPVPLPSLESVADIVQTARRILFPGYFTQATIEEVNLEYYLGQEVTSLYQKLSTQIVWSVKHDCYRYEHACLECNQQGRDKSLRLIESLPEMRRMLSLDVKAAFEGDPASRSYDQIIFSYPGLFAITVHRIAHVLYDLEVPLLPRIMSEYAHSKAGIDIHPGAEIGESFFIDHGTGVVIGETAEIGERVRIYQGVTLGALSIPRGAGPSMQGMKRHPTIEDDVVIYAGATILGGDTTIGARSVIGGNVWLTDSVPPDTKVMLKKPELVFLGGQKG